MDTVKELLSNAEVAFSNKQYETSLGWYQKALELTPNDVYALSRAGALSVALGKYELAMQYFGQARTVDPDNGDNAFNYGNACFFAKDHAEAFKLYVEAERLGCSEDVTTRLYYQMALLMSAKQDPKAAMLYFRKCEQSDKTGLMSMHPDLISEKLKLYMVQQDFAGAETCAAQLVAAAPADFKGYMIYFTILMAAKKYDLAEKILNDAGEYAEMTEENEFALVQQKAAFEVTMGESGGKDLKACCARAVTILEQYSAAHTLTPAQMVQLRMTQVEVLMKQGEIDHSIDLLHRIMGIRNTAPVAVTEPAPAEEIELDPEEIEEMAQRDMNRIQNKIDTGELDPDMGLYAMEAYDENGMLIHYYEEGSFDNMDEAEPVTAEPAADPDPETYTLTVQDREKAMFLLTTCHLEKEQFLPVLSLARSLKASENKYYHYYGTYVEALALRKTSSDTDEINRKYAQTLAFFRSRAFADPSDSMASVFRARLYAEQGKYDKAAEIAELLSESDRKAVQDYIADCRG